MPIETIMCHGKNILPGCPYLHVTKIKLSANCANAIYSPKGMLWLPMNNRPTFTELAWLHLPEEWHRISKQMLCHTRGWVDACCTNRFHTLRTIDHLGEIITKYGKDSCLASVKLHRMKCTKLITEVLGPALKESLKEDIRGKSFSLIVDETRCLNPS